MAKFLAAFANVLFAWLLPLPTGYDPAKIGETVWTWRIALLAIETIGLLLGLWCSTAETGYWDTYLPYYLASLIFCVAVTGLCLKNPLPIESYRGGFPPMIVFSASVVGGTWLAGWFRPLLATIWPKADAVLSQMGLTGVRTESPALYIVLLLSIVDSAVAVLLALKVGYRFRA